MCKLCMMMHNKQRKLLCDLEPDVQVCKPECLWAACQQSFNWGFQDVCTSGSASIWSRTSACAELITSTRLYSHLATLRCASGEISFMSRYDSCVSVPLGVASGVLWRTRCRTAARWLVRASVLQGRMQLFIYLIHCKAGMQHSQMDRHSWLTNMA